MESDFKRALFIVLQCTWGLGATLIGLIVFLIYLRSPHTLYRGAIDTRWGKKRTGLSLGLFIFTPDGNTGYSEKLRVHEYGHCIQAMVLGPLMLIVGMISIIWSRLPQFVRMRKEEHVPYTSCFVESWASKWGELVTGEKAIWD